MAVSAELVWLLQRLRSTPSRQERLRLLLEARRLVRDLSPSDRLVVARELGFDGAERVIEEVAERGGVAPGPWLKALGDVEKGGGGEAVGAVRGLFNPATRGAAVSHLIDAASGWVADLDAHRPDPSPEADDLDELSEQELLSEEAGEGVEAGGVGGGVNLEWPAPEPPPDVDVQRPPRDTTVVPANPPPRTGPTEHLAPLASEAALVHSAMEPEQAGVLQEPVDAVAEESSTSALDVDRVIAEIGASTQSSVQLVALKKAIQDLGDADDEVLVRVLSQFPAGWARRRALEVLFRSGVPGSIGGALRLLKVLTRPSELMWALTTLAASHPLAGQEADTLLAAVDSPTLARRLSHRLRRRR